MPCEKNTLPGRSNIIAEAKLENLCEGEATDEADVYLSENVMCAKTKLPVCDELAKAEAVAHFSVRMPRVQRLSCL